MTETLSPPTTDSRAVDPPTIRRFDQRDRRPLNIVGRAGAYELEPVVDVDIDVDIDGNIVIETTTRRGPGRERLTSSFDTGAFFAACAAHAELRVKMLEALTDRERRSRLPEWMRTR